MNKPNIKLRDPSVVMKLSRLGSFHQSKLSFLRSFIREFKQWNYKRNLFDLDKNGYGTAIYSFEKNGRNYSLVCFAQHIELHERSDRVIATKWDAAFVLHDGVPTKKDIDRLRDNVPKQEIGRVSYKELTLSRANKSVRAFEHVVESLSQGRQPDKDLLSKVGYLYRTTAVYGSGKFGLADRFRIKDRKEICGPFRLEMMLVYLVRQFTFDQVNHIAKSKNPNKAIKLDEDIARNLGIGNSTGLGMAPFIVNHPTLLHNWIYCREKALKEIDKFIKKHKKIVIKPTHGYGGKNILFLNKKLKKRKILNYINQHDQVMVQKFLPEIKEGDKRIFVIGGVIKGAIRRVPKRGSIISNIGQGGIPKKTTLTKQELKIAKIVSKNLKKNKIVFAGIDLISGYLTGDINITSPTGLKNYKDLTGINLAVDFWNYLEN